MFYRPLFSTMFGTLFLSGALNASEMIEIAPLGVAGYTENFSKGFDVNIQMKMARSGQVAKAKMTIQQLPGKPEKRLGGDWIGVNLTGSIFINKEKFDVRYLDLYDQRTFRLQHSIDLSEQSISSYQWTNVPESMWVGQKIKVGTVVEKDSSGKTLSSGDVDFVLSRVGDGFEFCTLKIVKNTESKEQEITKDCDLFDSSKRIVGTTIEVKLGSQWITSGAGKIRVK